MVDSVGFEPCPLWRYLPMIFPFFDDKFDPMIRLCKKSLLGVSVVGFKELQHLTPRVNLGVVSVLD